jgi:hypothetical protein
MTKLEVEIFDLELAGCMDAFSTCIRAGVDIGVKMG